MDKKDFQEVELSVALFETQEIILTSGYDVEGEYGDGVFWED